MHANINVYTFMSASTHTHARTQSPGCGGWHLTPEGPAGLSRRLNGELSSFTNPAAHIPHSCPPSFSKNSPARKHTHAQTSLPPSLFSSIHPSVLSCGCSLSPYFSAPPCSEWASLLLPLASSLSTVKDFKAKVRWSLTVTNRSNLLLSLPSASGPRPLGVKADIHAGRTLKK